MVVLRVNEKSKELTRGEGGRRRASPAVSSPDTVHVVTSLS